MSAPEVRSLVLGSLVLVGFVGACALAGVVLKPSLAFGTVGALTIPTCAACAWLERRRQQ